MEHLSRAMETTLDVIEAAAYRTRHDRNRYGDRGPIERDLRQLIYERDGWTCQWCSIRQGDPIREYRGDEILPYRTGEVARIVLDHVWPWSDHGVDRSWNLRVLCWECNSDRSNLLTDSAVSRPLPIAWCCTRCCQDCLNSSHDENPQPHLPVWCAGCRLAGTAEGPLEAML